MKMNNRRSFPGVIFRGLCCLLMGLAAGFLAFFGLALLRGGEGAGVGDALEAAANKGLLPLLTGAVKEGAIGSLGKSAPLALMALGAAFSWRFACRSASLSSSSFFFFSYRRLQNL